MATFMRPMATAIMIMLLYIIILVASEPNKKMAYYICNGQVYGDGDFFDKTLNYVLDQLQTDTASNGYNYYFKADGPTPSPSCYGHGACNGQISRDDCTDCVTYAAQQILGLCPKAIGAQIQLADCRTRYEQYEFSE